MVSAHKTHTMKMIIIIINLIKMSIILSHLEFSQVATGLTTERLATTFLPHSLMNNDYPFLSPPPSSPLYSPSSPFPASSPSPLPIPLPTPSSSSPSPPPSTPPSYVYTMHKKAGGGRRMAGGGGGVKDAMENQLPAVGVAMLFFVSFLGRYFWACKTTPLRNK